jgi:hypothetical protein
MVRIVKEHRASKNEDPETASETNQLLEQRTDKELISTANPSKLPTTSMIPWFRCARIKAKELFSRSACLFTWVEFWLGGGVRNRDAKNSTSRLSLDDSHRVFDVVSRESATFNGSSLTASGGISVVNLSCVARADPKNRLWGITVAPKIPTADKNA